MKDEIFLNATSKLKFTPHVNVLLYIQYTMQVIDLIIYDAVYPSHITYHISNMWIVYKIKS